MLEIQLEQLESGRQRILQSGSVAGERFSVWAVCVDAGRLSGIHRRTVATGLPTGTSSFVRVGIHDAPNGSPSAHYEFRHSLYRQALYRSLSGLNRSELHLRLGERLMPICTAGKPELASELAAHFEAGRDYERAARFLMLAAENAQKRFSLSRFAFKFFDRRWN